MIVSPLHIHDVITKKVIVHFLAEETKSTREPCNLTLMVSRHVDRPTLYSTYLVVKAQVTKQQPSKSPNLIQSRKEGKIFSRK